MSSPPTVTATEAARRSVAWAVTQEMRAEASGMTPPSTLARPSDPGRGPHSPLGGPSRGVVKWRGGTWVALGRLADAARRGGEVRDGQIAMAEAVAEAVRDERPLVVRAGTGTGKTWAYLVGALLATEGGRVVVATATKALQDQLAGKDLPSIAAAGIRPD